MLGTSKLILNTSHFMEIYFNKERFSIESQNYWYVKTKKHLRSGIFICFVNSIFDYKPL